MGSAGSEIICMSSQTIPGNGNGMCKGPEARGNMLCLSLERKSKRFEMESFHGTRPDRLLPRGKGVAIYPKSTRRQLLFYFKMLNGWKS